MRISYNAYHWKQCTGTFYSRHKTKKKAVHLETESRYPYIENNDDA